MTTTLAKVMKNPGKTEQQLKLLFQRVPYGVEVSWVDNGEEVYKILHPLSKINGDWIWTGEKQGTTSPTFQMGGFRMWSSHKGANMLATKQPDVEKMKGWVKEQCEKRSS